MKTIAPAPTPHVAATLNRQAKAVRVADFIETNPQIFSGHTDPESVAGYPAPLWALVNTAMGEPREMSPLTIAMVVGILTARSL
jgi:hypothetical protein